MQAVQETRKAPLIEGPGLIDTSADTILKYYVLVTASAARGASEGERIFDCLLALHLSCFSFLVFLIGMGFSWFEWCFVFSSVGLTFWTPDRGPPGG